MKFTISRKLYIGIGVVISALVILTAFFQVEINRTRSELEDLSKFPKLQDTLASRTIDHYKWVEALVETSILSGKEFKGQLDPTKCNLGKWYYSFTPPEELEKAYRALEAPHKALHETARKINEAVKRGNRGLAKEIFEKETKAYLSEVEDLLDEMRLQSSKMTEDSISQIESTQKSMSLTSLVMSLGIALFLLLSSVIMLVKPIRRNLQNISDWVNKLSTGDLTARIKINSNDEIGEIASRLEKMIKSVKHVISQTIEASHHVSGAADQLSEASQNFSQRITEQAASVEETSSTMEEMAASIRHTAENAREANKLAQNTKTLAESGISVMDETIKAMDEINRSSGKIASISNVIEEIAFQTNLLALNAAVEAARAGEHGKGFAVVASEIRSLAQRTAQSAKEITGLIKESVEKTGKGVQLAHELNSKLQEIGTGIKKVADLMDEVSIAAQEQASGINQVNSSIAQIDQVTQQNASLIEETAASAEELAAQARELLNLVSFFKIGEVEHHEKVTTNTVEPVRSAEREKKTSLSVPVTGEPALSTSTFSNGEKGDGGFEEF